MQQVPVVKEYLDIVFRRKWWIIVPAILGLLFSIALYFQVDKMYMAETRVQTRPQTISQNLLRPIVDSNPQDQVTTITAEITSEQYVQELDEELRLVGASSGPRDLTELARLLDARITLNPNPRQRYFDLKVSWNDPRTASAIANKLADIYIERYSEIRRELASGTLQELRDKRQEIEAALQDIRSRIERFRSEHKFELESYQRENQLQFESNNAEIDTLTREIRDMRGQIADIDLRMESGIAATPAPGTVDPRVDRLRAAEERLRQLKAEGKSEVHPEVRRATSEVAQLKAELGVTDEDDEGSAGMTPEELRRRQLEQQKESLEREILFAEKKIEARQDDNAVIQARMQRTPDNEIELQSLLTIEGQLRAEYDAARDREMTAQAGELVEELGKGEKFEVLKYARPPSRAYWPDFKLFLFFGFAVGFGVGVSLVLLLEVFDQSFKSEEQLAASVDLPILAVIPDLNRVADQSSRRQRATRRGGGRAAS